MPEAAVGPIGLSLRIGLVEPVGRAGSFVQKRQVVLVGLVVRVGLAVLVVLVGLVVLVVLGGLVGLGKPSTGLVDGAGLNRPNPLRTK